jgi:iron(III) transport system permease protein
VSQRITLWAAFGTLCLIGILPIGLMLAESVFFNGAFDLIHYKRLLIESAGWRLMGKTLLLASLTALFSTAVGAPLGVLFGKTDLPFRVPLAAFFIFPLLLPPYVTAVAWFRVFGRTGVLYKLIGDSASEFVSPLFFGLPGCVWVLGLAFVPVPMLLTVVSLKAIPLRIEEAARLFAPWSLVINRISLPIARAGILFGGILVFVLAAGEFTVPAFLRYDTFPVLSFTRFAASYDFSAATAAAAPMALIVFAIIAIEARFLKGDQVSSRLNDGSSLSIPLRHLRWPVFALIVLFLFAAVLSPIAALVSDTNLRDVTTAFAQSSASLYRGLFYSATAAALLTTLGFVLAWLVERRTLPICRAAEFTSLFLFALPGTVLAIGLIQLWNRPALNLIYASPILLVFAYIAQYAGLTMRLVRPSIAAIPNSMEEAGRMSGAGWIRRLSRIVAPLAIRGLTLSFVAAFLLCQRDVALPLMLAPPGLETLPARTMTLMANGSPSLISAMCALIVAGTALTSAISAALFPAVTRT